MNMILDFIAKCLDVLIWPIVALVLTFLFKDNLRDLIDRMRFWKYKDLVVGFGEESLDQEKPPKPLEAYSNVAVNVNAMTSKISSDKPATLFWLANDLMWSQDMLLRNAPSKKIIEGFRGIRDYIQVLGLSGSLAVIELSRLIKESEAIISGGSSEWSIEYRLALVRQIESIKWYLAAIAANEEPGFKKHRVFPSKQSRRKGA